MSHPAPPPEDSADTGIADTGLERYLRRFSLRFRVTMLAALVVAIAVTVISMASYFVVSRALFRESEDELRTQAAQALSNPSFSEAVTGGSADSLNALKVLNPELLVMVVRPSGIPNSDQLDVRIASDNIPLAVEEYDVIDGHVPASTREHGDLIIHAAHTADGWTLILARSLTSTREVLNRLAVIFTVVGGAGVILAALAGTAVAGAGLRPVARLRQATERVARDDDLRPLPVFGQDELARLTESFNTMLAALRESRERQARLVADAGHELKTPLTSLRTNTELLMALDRPDTPALAPEDKAGLHRDVIAQIEELTQLVGDLVDLAREDSGATVREEFDLSDIVYASLERARRRRHDVIFDVATVPWIVTGDATSMGRAILNLLDNAAKWSPAAGTVRLRMSVAGDFVRLTVADDGPGIRPEDRELVFERFYRSAESRTMPGSGLGLAIVHQVAVSHGGDVRVGESSSGGALLCLVLPGYAAESDHAVIPGDDHALSEESTERKPREES